MTNTISASDARKNLYSLLDDVSEKFQKITITKNGRAKAVLVSPQEFESWQETLDIMSDKKLFSKILKSEQQRKSGDVISEKELYNELGIDNGAA